MPTRKKNQNNKFFILQMINVVAINNQFFIILSTLGINFFFQTHSLPWSFGVSTGDVKAINMGSSSSPALSVAQLSGELHVTMKHSPFCRTTRSHMDSSQHFPMHSLIVVIPSPSLKVPAFLPLLSFLSLVIVLKLHFRFFGTSGILGRGALRKTKVRYS